MRGESLSLMKDEGIVSDRVRVDWGERQGGREAGHRSRC